MTFLRLGVATVVRDESGAVLLSRRGDMDVWNLPTGRLDKGEFMAVAAAREVQEETGIQCVITRPVGLYYQAGRGRMNVLFAARYTGGTLLQATSETRANQFFAPDALPDALFGAYMVQDALADDHTLHLHVLHTPPDVLRRVQRQLAWRYVKNLLRGKPEPRWARFNVHASLAVINSENNSIMSVADMAGQRVLPGVRVHGDAPPWEQVVTHLLNQYNLYELRQAQFAWAGLYENKTSGAIEFVFKTTIQAHSALRHAALSWTFDQSSAWLPIYRPFIHHVASKAAGIYHAQEG